MGVGGGDWRDRSADLQNPTVLSIGITSLLAIIKIHGILKVMNFTTRRGTGKVSIHAACHYKSQQIETRIESLRVLYSDASDLRKQQVMYPKMCLNISSQADLFIRRRKR